MRSSADAEAITGGRPADASTRRCPAQSSPDGPEVFAFGAPDAPARSSRRRPDGRSTLPRASARPRLSDAVNPRCGSTATRIRRVPLSPPVQPASHPGSLLPSSRIRNSKSAKSGTRSTQAPGRASRAAGSNTAISTVTAGVSTMSPPSASAHCANVNSVQSRCPRACVCSSGSSSGQGSRSRTSSSTDLPANLQWALRNPAWAAPRWPPAAPRYRLPAAELLLCRRAPDRPLGAAVTIPESGDPETASALHAVSPQRDIHFVGEIVRQIEMPVRPQRVFQCPTREAPRNSSRAEQPGSSAGDLFVRACSFNNEARSPSGT